jgi:hypothetical protein
LSLARILMLPQWCETLIEHLQDPRAALTAAIEARSRLLETLSKATEAGSARERTREALRLSLKNTVAELEETLRASPGTQSVIQADRDLWAAEIALLLSSFIQDTRAAIAAA